MSPRAEPKSALRPSIGANTLPNEAPIQRAGTISPPLKPQPRVIAVNRSLMIKA